MTMKKIDVMFTRTNDGDYIADFDCSQIELPASSVFFFQAVVPSELIAAEREAADLRAQLAQVTAERNAARAALSHWLMYKTNTTPPPFGHDCQWCDNCYNRMIAESKKVATIIEGCK